MKNIEERPLSPIERKTFSETEQTKEAILTERLLPLCAEKLRQTFHDIRLGTVARRFDEISELAEWLVTPEEDILAKEKKIKARRSELNRQTNESGEWIRSISPEIDIEPTKEKIAQLEEKRLVNKETLDILKVGTDLLRRTKHHLFFYDVLEKAPGWEKGFYTFHDAVRDETVRYGVRLIPREIDTRELAILEEKLRALREKIDKPSQGDDELEDTELEDLIEEIFSPDVFYRPLRWREAVEELEEVTKPLCFLVNGVIENIERIKKLRSDYSIIPRIPEMIAYWTEQKSLHELHTYVFDKEEREKVPQATYFRQIFTENGMYGAGQYLMAIIAREYREALKDPLAMESLELRQETAMAGINWVVSSYARRYIFGESRKGMVEEGRYSLETLGLLWGASLAEAKGHVDQITHLIDECFENEGQDLSQELEEVQRRIVESEKHHKPSVET